jgi:hypothetical protein
MRFYRVALFLSFAYRSVFVILLSPTDKGLPINSAPLRYNAMVWLKKSPGLLARQIMPAHACSRRPNF